MRRLLLFLLPAIVLGVSAGAWYWLLHSEPGARWIWARAQAASGDTIQVDSLSGALASGVTLSGFRLTTGAVQLSVGNSALTVDVDLLPPRIDIQNAVLDDVRMVLARQDGAEPARGVAEVIESLALPIAINVADLAANGIALQGASPNGEFTIAEIRLAGGWHDSLRLDHLSFNSAALDGELAGSLSFARPFATTFDGGFALAAVPTLQPGALDVRIAADGSLDRLAVRASSSPAKATVQGTITGLPDALAWDLQIDVAELAQSFGANGLPLRMDAAHITTNGNFERYRYTATGTVAVADLAPARVAAEGHGDLSSLTWTSLDVAGEDATFEGSGRVAWGDAWSLASRLSVASFDPGAWWTAWPQDQPLHGLVDFELDAQYLAVRESHVTAGDTGMSARVNAQLDIETSVVAGELHWEELRWPVTGDTVTVASRAGSISVDGSLDDWRVSGQVDVSTPAVPAGRFRIDGRGDRDHIEGRIVDGLLLGGQVAGSASYRWRDEYAWALSAMLEGVDAGSLLLDEKGIVSGRVEANGQRQPFEIEARLTNVNGTLRGRSLNADGGIAIADERLHARRLQLLHGQSRVLLDGDLYSGRGLDFELAIAELANYVDDASGTLSANGKLSLHGEQPSLAIRAASPSLEYGQWRVVDLHVEDRPGGDARAAFQVDARELRVAGNVFDEFRLQFAGDRKSQSLQLESRYDGTRVELALGGEVDDMQAPSAWSGELQTMNLTPESGTAIALSRPAPIAFSRLSARAGPACLVADSGMSLCADAEWVSGQQTRVDAKLIDVPVNLVNGFVDTQLRFDQNLNGTFRWRQGASVRTTGSADIAISRGTIVSNDFPDVTIDTDPGLVSFDIVDGRLLSGKASLPMRDFGHANAEFSVQNVGSGGDSEISGVVDIDLADIALAAAFSPLIDAAHGVLRADLAFAGRLSKPVVAGTFSVTDGGLTYLPIGLRVDDVDIVSRLHDSGEIEFGGTFRAGEGRGTVVTRADYAKTLEKGLEVELRGSDLAIIDVPDLQARADIDVQLGYDWQTLTLGGTVRIPHARVRPANLGVSRATESEDVVIIAGQLPEDELRRTRQRRTQIFGSLDVALGDDILIDLGLATASLEGSTKFTWNGGVIPMADGRYDLGGSVQAFGQVLEVTDGGLRFPRIPADNPFIRVRAEREIYGNAQVKTAGILVDGTVRNPTIEAYTTPLTTEERALALLVTGSDFDYEQGVGAIDFGTYIAPRVFVSYGVGLFERENVIRIRYDLSSGFGITATSGQQEAGVDVNYRIER